MTAAQMATEARMDRDKAFEDLYRLIWIVSPRIERAVARSCKAAVAPGGHQGRGLPVSPCPNPTDTHDSASRSCRKIARNSVRLLNGRAVLDSYRQTNPARPVKCRPSRCLSSKG